MKKDLFPLEEIAYKPDNYEEIYKNDKFHFSDKGCDTEMVLEKKGDCYGLYKYCKTHKVLCSKTGWELGWYQGTKSETGEHCMICDNRIQRGNFCRFCRNKINSFRTYIQYNVKKDNPFNVYGGIKDITIQSMEYVKGIYIEKMREVEKGNSHNKNHIVNMYKKYIEIIDKNIKYKEPVEN